MILTCIKVKQHQKSGLTFILVALFAVSVFGVEPESVFKYSAYPDVNNNYAEASFACVVPNRKPCAILLLMGGTDSDARPWLDDPRWQALAEKEHLVLIGACLRGAGEAYEVASGGSGQALLEAITEFSKQSGRPELDQLPLILYGHSAGAQFGFNFACWKPERVRAIVCIKSGPLPEPPLEMSPTFSALFIVGERDQAGRVREVARSFAAGRSRGAPWCLAFQPNAGHGAEGCRDLAEVFINAVTSTTSEGRGYAELVAPAKFRTVAANDPRWSWLPSKSFAAAWRGFAKGVQVQSLLMLPDEKPAKQLTWRPITPLPERIDGSKERVRFEYAVSLSKERAAITEVKVTASSPATAAAATRRSDQEWSVKGEFDLRDMPLGPFKSHLEVELLTATGIRERGDLTLFTRLTGPVSVAPASVYYGVISRESVAFFEVIVRSNKEHLLQSCEVVSSDPRFLAVSVSPSEKPGEYRARCTIQAGTSIGARNGRLTFRVVSDREQLISVPFYGFVKK